MYFYRIFHHEWNVYSARVNSTVNVKSHCTVSMDIFQSGGRGFGGGSGFIFSISFTNFSTWELPLMICGDLITPVVDYSRRSD